MAFPLRLIANVALGLASRALGLHRNDPLVFDLAPNADSGSLPASISSPIVWIGAAEPLQRPEVPTVANGLAASGHYVFLQTNGALLRRRIHELQPLPRLFLTIRFDAGETAHGTGADQAGAFGSALEGIRTARLSGFLICAQLILLAGHSARELARLHGELRNLDLDGFLISPATHAPDLQYAVAAARRQLLEYRWALLSRLLDCTILPAATSLPEISLTLPTPLRKPPSPREESIQIQ